MVKTIYNNGSRIYAAWVNAMQNLVFDDQDIDGHYPRLNNDALSNAAGQIKPEWLGFRDALKVTAGAGLSVSVAGGSVHLPTGLLLAIAPTVVSGLPNNTTTFIFINSAGAIVQGVLSDSIRFLLARVTTAGGTVSLVEDLRQRFEVAPPSNLIKTLGGTGGQGDYNLASGSATLSDGLYYFRNFTVAAGAVLTVRKFAKIICSGNVVINGAINVTPLNSGGGNPSLVANVVYLPLPGSGIGPGAFGGGGELGNLPPEAYNYAVSPVGSGGASGGIAGNAGSSAVVTIGRGGFGGGGLWFEVGGSFSLGSTGAIAINGENASPNTYGGGAGEYTTCGGSAGSGGTFVALVAQSFRAEAGSAISCNAGNPANAFRSAGSALNASGGCGSGGGQVVIACPVTPVTLGSISVAASAAGLNNVPASPSGFGGASGASNGGNGGIITSGFSGPGQVGKIFIGTFLPVGA